MSNWSDCEAVTALTGDLFVDDHFPDSPKWLHDIALRAHDTAHAVMAFSGYPVTCRLWIARDEDRRLPMPLRFAAPHPCSPSAIVGVLTRQRDRSSRITPSTNR